MIDGPAHPVSPRRTGLARRLAVWLALLAVSARAAAAAESMATALDRLYDDYIEARLARYPVSATFIGDHRYDARLENPADPAFERERNAEQRHFLARARAIDRDALSPAQRIGYDIFLRDREEALARSAFPDRLLPIDQMDSMASTFALLGSGTSAQPFVTAEDYEAFLARADGFAAWVDAAIAAMREGMASGVVNPRVIMARVVPQLRAIIKDSPTETLFWQPVAAMPASIPEPRRRELTAAYRTAIVTTILPAYRRLADFIEHDYLPQARESVGMGALPQGEAWYRSQIRKHTTTDMTADEIHALGLAEMQKVRHEMHAVMRTVHFRGTLAQFCQQVRHDPRYYATRPAQLLAGFRALKHRVHAALPRLFHDLPRGDYEIRAVEDFRAASAAGGSYQAGSLDGRRPGIFYVNTHDLRAQPLYSMETLTLHEALPGHHYQIALQQEQPSLSRYQRLNSFKAYVEGWALYSETLGHELGLYRDPMQWYGHLDDEMLRAMRLVVDTGLHAQGWSREDAIAFMRANSAMSDVAITAEVERYIAWPGQALAYKIGQIKISALRARAAQALGDSFDPRDFHAVVLSDGAVPLDILESKVERWLKERGALALEENH